MKSDNQDSRVLILAPVGQDAVVMGELLARNGIAAQVCRTPAECALQLDTGAGALLMTEEALELERALDLFEKLEAQPAWSEVPVIVLTTGGESRLTRLLTLATRAAGTITLLERPLGSITLLRTIEVALNSRRRQYQVRDLLLEQRQIAEQLREVHARLADHARELEELVQLRTASLKESNQQLRREIIEREKAERSREELRRKLTNAQEEERRRIARELHDQMGQNLTALNFGLRSLSETNPADDQFLSTVRQLQELAAQTARDLHRVALELRPTALDDFGLVKALRSLVETWTRHCQIECDFEPGNYDSAGVSAEVETTLYRVAQEALNNVAKHSGAMHVSVLLGRSARGVEAIIEDDGCGFDTATPSQAAADGSSRLGLVGMKERLSTIGGHLQIDSSAGAGTTILARVPLVRPQ